MTIWEYDAIRLNLKNRGLKRINQEAIIEAREVLHNQIQQSVKSSKKARRDNQKLKNRDIELKEFNDKLNKKTLNSTENITTTTSQNSNFWDEEIPEF